MLADPHNFYVTTLLRAGVVGFWRSSRSASGCCWALRRTPAASGWRPADARGVPGVAGDAGRLVPHLGTRDGAGHHHRARGRPGGSAGPWRCPGSRPRPGSPPSPQGRRGTRRRAGPGSGDREASGPASRKAAYPVALNDRNATQAAIRPALGDEGRLRPAPVPGRVGPSRRARRSASSTGPCRWTANGPSAGSSSFGGRPGSGAPDERQGWSARAC